MVITTSELLMKYTSYADTKGKIRRLVNEKKLIPLTRGLYEDNPDADASALAAWIYGPSYLSFDYVLSLHGIIPERVYSFTSATYAKHKSKIYTNSFGTYLYRDVPDAVFSYGVCIEVDGPYSKSIASCEKALCDKLYTISPVRNRKEFEYLLFENLRLDEDIFWSLNLGEILFLSPLYRSTNLDFLAKFIKKEARCGHNLPDAVTL